MTGKQDGPTNRLCSEIQLFDLCDLDRCDYRKERFCTNPELLRKFEAIKEEDDRHTLVYDENETADENDFEDDTDLGEVDGDYDEDER